MDQTIIGNAGIKCGTDDGYIHPAYPSERSSGTQSGARRQPVRVSHLGTRWRCRLRADIGT